MAKLRANLEALRTLRLIQSEDRPATAPEQAVLARWAGWGAVPGIFEAREHHPDFARLAEHRAALRELLSDAEYAAAERNTINAHYTDAGYVRPIWDAVTDLGFNGGDVLEPGSGSGNFIGLAPPGARMVGVELEPVSAAISQALYPHAQIRVESFAATRAPQGAFDLAVGNVPFADVQLIDRKHNPGRHSMHDHFIIKSLHLTRPGGLVALLTSRYTMDKTNPAARREMAALADLVAAVRLPSRAHQAAAGTQVVTDLLILRRREPDREPAGIAWEQLREVDLTGGTERVNEYFAARPDRVLGEMTVGRGMHRDNQLVVAGDGDTAEHLVRMLREVVDEARRDGLTLAPRAGDAPGQQPLAVLAEPDQAEGHLRALDDGTFTVIADGQVVPFETPDTQAAELRALLGLRDTVTALLAAEAAGLDDGDEPDGDGPTPLSPASLRAALNLRYDAYVAEFGPLNRYTTRPIRRRNAETGEVETLVDDETGEPKLMRINPPMGGFRRTDPHAATVFALEVFDDATQSATKADIFHRRVIVPRNPQLGADNPQDALAICLDQHGVVSLAEIARLLGTSEPEARDALGELVYEEPGSGRLVEAPEYLSGDVRIKLDAAQAAAQDDPRFEANVRALQKVIPRDLGPGEINAALGAPFIAAEHVQQFLRETLRDPKLTVQHPGGSDWAVKGKRSGVLATSTWGTGGMSAPVIAQRLLTKTPIRVFVEVEEGKRALDPEATAAAQAKGVELEERFGTWVWEDPDRAEQISTTYNRMFNGTVPRSYVGVQRSLPGLAATFTPRPHQVEAVARIVAEPAVGLFHAVGAGKTAVMAMAAMEERRLGLITKPAIVVPNHMLEQFTREFLQIYPQARLLAAGRDDLPQERRRRFVARAATGRWDAVIMAASFFERLPMPRDEQEQFLNGELEELRERVLSAEAQASANGEDPKRNSAVKRLQRSLLRKEERIKDKLENGKDPGVTFVETGIDKIYRDELHELKNDTVTSSIPDAGHDGSDRAVDFRMKLDYLRRTYGPRVVVGATATPIANSVRELYVVTRQLRPDLLQRTGTMDFDTWAACFAKVVTAIEVSPTGSGFRMQARLAKYANVPELSLMMRTYGDVRTPDDLKLPTPLLTVSTEDGQRAPHIVTLDASPELSDFISSLDARVDAIRNRQVEPDQDNMLKVSSEARAASLDLRLLGTDQSTPGKIDAAAERIAAIWAENRDNVYHLDPDADPLVPHPTPGALQLVFCDQGTPNPERWNVYDTLRDDLVARGLPREQIRYIHEADTDAKKAALFQQCRTGQIAVLIGSTARMGVGTNVQLRAIALHHLDCPWRPADVTQREGRILRQGNQNAEVSIYRYVVAGSFDAFSWQTVARKGTFIDQIMRGTSGREIDDVSDETLQAHQIKAIATGNPLLMDREQINQDLARLERLSRSHHNTQAGLRRRITELEGWIATDHRRIAAYDEAIARRQDTRGELFTMTVAGHQLAKRPEAGRALQHALTAASSGLPTSGQRQVTAIAHLGGFAIDATVWHGRDGILVAFKLDGIAAGTQTASLASLVEGDPTGAVRRLENLLVDLDKDRARIEQGIANQQEEIARAQEQLGVPFPRQGELVDARRRLRAVNAAIDAIAADDLDVPAGVPAPRVPVTVADWMPAELRDSLTDDERAWLDKRVNLVANQGALQHAARTRDLDAFAPVFDKAFTTGLGDATNPGMSVAILMNCDNPAWRHTLYDAAGRAVHRVVQAAPPPEPAAGTPQVAADRPDPAPAAPPVVLTEDEIRARVPALAAQLTRDERAWLNQATTRLCEDPDLGAVAQAGDPARFAHVFGPAMTAELVNAPARLADLAVDGDDLVDELHAVIQHYVYAKAREPEAVVGPAPADSAATAAAVAATAFPAATTTAPSPASASARSGPPTTHGVTAAAEPEPAR